MTLGVLRVGRCLAGVIGGLLWSAFGFVRRRGGGLMRSLGRVG
jgi:hypothetical protein